MGEVLSFAECISIFFWKGLKLNIKLYRSFISHIRISKWFHHIFHICPYKMQYRKQKKTISSGPSMHEGVSCRECWEGLLQRLWMRKCGETLQKISVLQNKNAKIWWLAPFPHESCYVWGVDPLYFWTNAYHIVGYILYIHIPFYPIKPK